MKIDCRYVAAVWPNLKNHRIRFSYSGNGQQNDTTPQRFWLSVQYPRPRIHCNSAHKYSQSRSKWNSPNVDAKNSQHICQGGAGVRKTSLLTPNCYAVRDYRSWDERTNKLLFAILVFIMLMLAVGFFFFSIHFATHSTTAYNVFNTNYVFVVVLWRGFLFFF